MKLGKCRRVLKQLVISLISFEKSFTIFLLIKAARNKLSQQCIISVLSGNSETWPHLDKPEEQSLNFVISVPREIILWQQQTCVLQWPGGFYAFRWRWSLFKCCFFQEVGHIYDGNRLPIWFFSKRCMTGKWPKPKKNNFAKNISFTWTGSIFSSIIC